MKRYLSVLALIAQNSIYRVLAILMLMTAADAALAWYHLVNRGYGIINIFRSGGFGIVLALTFALIAVVLIRRGDIYRGPQSYTMLRLGISERAVFGLQILYSGFCWFLLWGVQLAVFYIICKIWFAGLDASSAVLNCQQIFLMFYTQPLPHSLLPMEDVLAWIANLSIVGTLAVITSYWIVQRRSGNSGGALIGAYGLTLLCFTRELGSFMMNIVIIVFCVLNIGLYTWRGLFPKKPKGGGEYA